MLSRSIFLSLLKPSPIFPQTKAGRLALGLLLLQFIPYLLLVNHSYIRIHDTLEGELIWYDLLARNHDLLNFSPHTVVAPIMNGLPRYALHSGLSFTGFFIWLMGTYAGYIFNYILLHSMAYWGMYLLLTRHFIKEEEDKFVAMFVALAFAWAPIFTVFGATVAGQPWVVMAFLNVLTGKETWRDRLSIVLFPFYSSVVWAAPAMIGLVAVIMAGKWIAKPHHQNVRRYTRRYIGYIGLMGVLYIIVNFQLFFISLTPNFVSHRKAYDPFYEETRTLLSSIGETFSTLLLGHYHVANMCAFSCLLAIGLSFFYPTDKARQRLMLSMLGGLLFICVYQGFYNWINYYGGSFLPMIHEIKFNRIKILLPFLWLLLFALALVRIKDKKLIIVFLFSQVTMNMAANDEFQHNIRQLFGWQTKPNFEAFTATHQFAEIDKFIGKDKSTYRVVSLGINPSISQHYGFYTLDGLMALYDLRHKMAFREIMAGELDKSEELRRYFDGWGNRCYLFSAELGKNNDAFMISKFQQSTVVHNLAFNAAAFHKMGGQYVISSLKIENAEQTGLHLLKQFDDPVSWWTIYLYEAK